MQSNKIAVVDLIVFRDRIKLGCYNEENITICLW